MQHIPLNPPGPESDEKLEHIVATAGMPVFVSINNHTVLTNPQLEAMVGYTSEELRALPTLEMFHPDERDMVAGRAISFYEGSTVFPAHATRFMARSGEVLSVQVIGWPTYWRGKPAFLNYVRDETKERKLENELQIAMRLQSIGTLAGGVAHDFNNILMVIQGTVSLLLEDLDPAHRHYNDLKTIEAQVESGSSLTRQLLGYARQKQHRLEVADLTGLVDNTAETFARTRKDIHLQRVDHDDVYFAYIDKGSIEQVLLNLLINAGDAMPQGGNLYVRLYEARGAEIKHCKNPYEAFICMEVSDTGEGISEAILARVFDPFFTTKEMGRGTGLGLSSAYGIVKSHSGYIEVESMPGKGATFKVFLPKTDRAATSICHSEATKVVVGNEGILLVDDEEALVMIGQRMMERLGYRVFTARSGEEALEVFKLHQDQIDLVLMDMIMPGMSGGETSRKLKAINDRVLVVLASGYTKESQEDELAELECAGFIQKPYTMSALSEQLRNTLESARQPNLIVTSPWEETDPAPLHKRVLH
ncbi:MAG: response regulator [Pseudomonadales bacterium]|nr:response regulator [Pseudomonadales bacterium]